MCCGRDPRPSGSSSTSSSAAPRASGTNGAVRYRLVPPVGDPIDGFATRQEAEAEQARVGGEIKRVVS